MIYLVMQFLPVPANIFQLMSMLKKTFFFFVTDALDKKAIVLIPAYTFLPSLIFVCEAMGQWNSTL